VKRASILQYKQQQTNSVILQAAFKANQGQPAPLTNPRIQPSLRFETLQRDPAPSRKACLPTQNVGHNLLHVRSDVTKGTIMQAQNASKDRGEKKEGVFGVVHKLYNASRVGWGLVDKLLYALYKGREVVFANVVYRDFC